MGEAGLSTFLITDIEGSTRLWEEHAAEMGASLALHDRLLRDVIEGASGTVIKTTGDGLLAVFDDPAVAVGASLAVQRALRDASWGRTGPLRVRMALHAGTAESRDGDYFGPALNRSARILAIGHGGQVICSAVAAVLARDRLPAEVELRDLGSHRLRDLDRPEQVFQVEVPDLPRDFPPLRSLSTRRSNLPLQLTSFVGREKEVSEVEAFLARHRLVTLIGVGGTGKTRLMLEAAGRVADGFADGAWLAELAPITDPSQIPSEVARALGAPEVPGVPTMAIVTSFLADKDVLLLLDNAEHLVDGVAAVAERLLAAAPRLRILATSREALTVPGEAVLQLQSLSCPAIGLGGLGRSGGMEDEDVDLAAAASTEAVRLFVERAAAVDPGFTLGQGNVASISEICRRLDGIPLAIELAAARVSAMSPDDIAKRLGDRFRLLAGGRRTAVPRQQTLHALIDWSWDLLTEDDRRLLRRLSVFVGGWTAAMAVSVVGDEDRPLDEIEAVDGLTRLVDRSLVQVDRGTTTRYRMLETIRQYAREKLIAAGEVGAVADRHFAAFSALAAASQDPLHGPHMVDWLDRLDGEQENLIAALEWGLEAWPWEAVRMASALLGYWASRVMSQDNDARIVTAIEIARRTVRGSDVVSAADQALAARLMGEAARLWAMSGRGHVALEWAKEAVTLAEASGDATAELFACAGMAVSTVFAGQAGDRGAEVRAWFERVFERGERTGQWWLVAMAYAFGGASFGAFDPDGGLGSIRRGAEAAQRSGSPYAIAAVAMAQGRALGRLGETDGAVASFGVAIERYMELGDDRLELASKSDLAHALRRGGRTDEATALYGATIAGWVHLGHRGAVANQLENIAFIDIDQGRYDRAARLLGAAATLREAARAAMAFDEEPEFRAYEARLREAMTAAAYEAASAAGRALSGKDAVALAVEA
ncbi:MAG TPA: adenylate/guanylate cyclase domain-containing protein [Candidatus Sulfomarinibacteraceae bacterium]|nr:adenylate/guanylate cyclase domain-containing protein [Candidatus Sulfomarinibacteraceae bacterium]